MTFLIAYVLAVVLAVSLVTTLVVVLCWRAHLYFWSRRLAHAGEYSEVQELSMPDGATIALRRVARLSAPPGSDGQTAPESGSQPPPSSRVPVLLIHGLAMNHQTFDLGDDSLARRLQRSGFDVWLLTLRSGRSYLWPFGPRHCTFSAMVEQDLPRAVDAVLARTGHAQLDIAGLSMGGMLVYASLGRTLDVAKVRKVVLFGSPGSIRPLGLLSWSRMIPARLALTLPLRAWLRTVAFAPRLVPALLWRRLYNPMNADPVFERTMHWNVWEDIPGQLGRDFVTWSANKGVVTVGGLPVLAGLSRVNVPVLFFAGAADWLAPLDTVRAAYDAWGSALSEVPKQLVVLGREASGSQCDYGHCDLVLGRHAARDVFEPAALFLA